jgi:hypothetical protein
MPFIPFAGSEANRASYGLPQAYLRNMFVEGTPQGPSSDARMSRPGLLLSYEIGDGPIQGIFQNAGAVDGSIYAVSDGDFYENTTYRGSVASGSVARIAASSTRVVVVMGGVAYVWNGVTFTAITDPDLPGGVIDVAYAGGRFLYAIAASDTFYYSAIGDPTDIDGLAFATAESSPDALVAIVTSGDEIAMFGQESTEWWTTTADPDAPFQRTVGRRYDKGALAQGAIQNIDNALFFLGNDRIVYRTANVPARVSTHAIEEWIRKSTDTDDSTSFVASFDGHSFYVLTLPNVGTWAYDVSNDTWAEWTSFSQPQFRGRWATEVSGQTFVGDSQSGKVFRFDPETYSDDDGDPIDRAASVFVPVTGGFVANSSIMLQCRRGVGNANEPAPAVRMAYSDEAGASFDTTPGTVPLGAAGDFDFKQIWRRLGMMRSPGRLFVFSCPDPVSVVFEAVTLNEGRP